MSMSLFARPDRLWLLVALIPLLAWMIRGGRRRARDWSALGQAGLPSGDGSPGWFVAMIFIGLAMGQPRWGRVPGHDLPAGHDLILLVDVSRSMAARDAVPDRLGVAIDAGSSLLRALATRDGNRAGVVAYAGRGVVRCPLTAHLESAVDALQKLQPGEVEPGGTDLGAAIDAAIGAFDDEEHAEGRTIVVFSDGEDHVGSWTSEVDRLKAERIIVHAVAIGDPSRGHPIPTVRSDSKPRTSEPPVETRRSDVALEAIAKATSGALVPLGLASTDLGALFRDRIEPTARRIRDDLRVPERAERFPSFLLLAIGFGLTACWPGLARRPGRRLAWAMLAVALFSVGASPPSKPVAKAADWVAQGQRAYEAGRFADALEAFEKAIDSAPGTAVPRYNAASALYQLRRYPEAIRRYEEARSRGDATLSIKIDYAMGNTLLAMGDLTEAVARYDACLATTLGGPALDAVRLDAAANREFAVRRLQSPTNSPESEGSNPPGSKKSRPSPRPSPKGPGDRDGAEPSEPVSPKADGNEGPQGNSANPPASRASGGGGGSGPAPPPADSPEARLNAALDQIRESRTWRPPDPLPSGSKGVGKDW